MESTLTPLPACPKDGVHLKDGSTLQPRGDNPDCNQGSGQLNSQSLPLTILIGPDTQGASEIFAEALQATGRAVLIGQTSPEVL
jgi:C-terminal processing protease CtpA/Prc